MTCLITVASRGKFFGISPMESSSPSSHSSAPQSPNSFTLHPVNSVAFKRENRRKRKERKRQEKLELLLEDWAPLAHHCKPAAPIVSTTSVTDWPLDPPTDPNPEPAAWSLNPRLPSAAKPQPEPSAEALAQNNALRLCREFFATAYGSDEEDWAAEDRNDEKSYDFFKRLFDTEADLRDFYRRDWAKGEFYCLACGGIGEKLGKKFCGLVAVAQHANFISKSRRIMVHRAYGRVVCELVGLKIDLFKDVQPDDDASDGEFQDEEALEGLVENAGEDGAYLIGGAEMNVDVP